MKQTDRLTRRGFLKILALTGVAAATLKLGVDALEREAVARESRVLMGTVVNLTLVGADGRQAQAAIEACLDRMQALEEVLSHFKPQSQLSRLNRDGRLEGLSPEFRSLIQSSLDLHRTTGGAFDITVKPLVDLYAAAQLSPQGLPAAQRIREALALVGSDMIRLGEEDVAFERAGMQITLDGIAKGYIVDAGVSELRATGFENVLVEAGGDLAAHGHGRSRQNWRIGLQSPRQELDGFLAHFEVRDQALATSGDYMASYSNDFVNHHIVDPRSGRSPLELASASVLAPSATLADGLATALMVMGVEKGLALVEQTSDVEAILVSKSLELYRSSGVVES